MGLIQTNFNLPSVLFLPRLHLFKVLVLSRLYFAGDASLLVDLILARYF